MSTEDMKYRGMNVEPVEILYDKEVENLGHHTRPQPVEYGCCAESCSLKSFALFLVVGKAYKK